MKTQIFLLALFGFLGAAAFLAALELREGVGIVIEDVLQFLVCVILVLIGLTFVGAFLFKLFQLAF